MTVAPLSEVPRDAHVIGSHVIYRMKEPQDKRLKVDIASIREQFEEGNISCVRWSPGHYLIADALTKISKYSASHLMNAFRTGLYDSHPDSESRFSPKGEVRTGTQEYRTITDDISHNHGSSPPSV